MNSTKRVSVRTLGLFAALAPVAMLASGCSGLKEFTDSLETLEHVVTVCEETDKLRSGHIKKLEDAAAKLSAAKPGDRAAIVAFNQVARTEFTALHGALQGQVAKAKEPELKEALTALDSQVGQWAAKPETWVQLDKSKRDAAGSKLDKVCELAE